MVHDQGLFSIYLFPPGEGDYVLELEEEASDELQYISSPEEIMWARERARREEEEERARREEEAYRERHKLVEEHRELFSAFFRSTHTAAGEKTSFRWGFR